MCARKRATPIGPTARATTSPCHYRDEVLPLRKIISDETMLRYGAMQIDVFALLTEARQRHRRERRGDRGATGFLARQQPISSRAGRRRRRGQRQRAGRANRDRPSVRPANERERRPSMLSRRDLLGAGGRSRGCRRGQRPRAGGEHSGGADDQRQHDAAAAVSGERPGLPAGRRRSTAGRCRGA